MYTNQKPATKMEIRLGASISGGQMRLWSFGFVFLLAGASAAYAQVQAGRLVGTIYDPQRATIPRATVTVTDAATNISKRVTADGAGDYVVTPLDPGTYTVT